MIPPVVSGDSTTAFTVDNVMVHALASMLSDSRK